MLFAGLLGLAILASVSACRVTWRQPEIKPLNPVRQFDATASALCDALLQTLEDLDLEPASITRQEDACLVETDYRRLSEGEERWQQLREAAYVTGAEFFSHGRFLITASVRALAEGARIRLTTRIEGFDAGYRVLRSTGAIEEEVFARIASSLGEDPDDESR